MADETIALRYAISTSGLSNARQVQNADKAIRESVKQTSVAYKSQGSAAAAAARQMQTASSTMVRAARAEGQAAQAAARSVKAKSTAEREGVGSANRLANAQRNLASAYQRTADAARRAATEAKKVAQQSGGSGQFQRGAGVAAGLRLPATAAAGAAGFGLVAGIRDAARYEQVMARVRAVSSSTAPELAALDKQVTALAQKTPFNMTQTADAAYQLTTAGLSIKETMQTLPGTINLASVAGIELADSARVQATTLNQFGLAASDATRVADVLAKTVNVSAVEVEDMAEALKYAGSVSKASGQSLETVSAAIGILGDAGIRGSMAGTAIRRVMINLQAPTDKMATALGTFGLKVNDVTGPKGLLPLPAILGKIVRGAKDLETPARNAALARIFGSEALPSAITLVEKGEKAFRNQQKAIQDSAGYAAAAGNTMRNTVAGAWDNFTGSVQAASIALARQFQPALKDALNVGAGGVNKLMAGLGGQQRAAGAPRVAGPTGAMRRAGGDAAPPPEVSGWQKAGLVIRGVVNSIVGFVKGALPVVVRFGRQLVDAFKPAAPFFQNILLPVFVGVFKGVVGSVVAAWTVIRPVLKLLMTGLGLIGTAARPLRPVFEGIGAVIGFVFGGPILKGIGLLGKLGGVFRLLAVPIKIVGGVMSGFGRLVAAAVGRAAGAVGKLGGPFKTAADFVIRQLGRIPRGFRSVFSGLAGIAKAAFDGLISVITASINTAISVVNAAGGLLSKVPGVNIPKIGSVGSGRDTSGNAAGGAGKFGGNFRRGGMVRFQEGGMVPAMVSPGERIVYGGQQMTVPGARTAADSVFMHLPTGAAVLTTSGQSMVDQGASLGEAISRQLPHFAGGGIVRAAQAARGAGLSGTKAVTAVAIAGPESSYNARARALTAKEDSRGFWQINLKAHEWARKMNLYDPDVNAKAMHRVSGGGSNWNPWTAFTKGTYRSFLGRARTAVGQVGPGGTGAGDPGRRYPDIGTMSARMANINRFRLRQPITDNPFGAGFSAGQAGARSLRDFDLLNEVIGASRVGVKTIAATPAGGSGSDSAAGGRGTVGSFRPGGGWAGTENLVMQAIRGLGRATFKRAANHRLSISNPSSDHNMAIKNAFAADLGPGDSIFQTLSRRLGIPARKGSWNKFMNKPVPGFRTQLLWQAPDGSHRDHNHLGIRRMRTGGLAGAFGRGMFPTSSSTPGVTSPERRVRGITSIASAGGIGRMMTSLADLLSDAEGYTYGRLNELGAYVRGVIDNLRKGGLTRREGVQVRRLQGVLSLVEGEMGRRVGESVANAELLVTRAMEQRQRRMDFQMRLGSVDSSSSVGQMMTAGTSMQNLQSLQGLQKTLQTQLARAQKARNQAVAKEIGDKLYDVQNQIEDSLVSYLEAVRASVLAAAQERVDAAARNVTSTQTTLGNIENFQRIQGVANTPEAMEFRAAFQRGFGVNALSAQRDASQTAAGVAFGQGNAPETFRLLAEVESINAQIVQTIADAQQLQQEAQLLRAQNVVDLAAHRTTMSSTRFTTLQLQQQLAGTFDSAGSAQARGDFIQSQIIPAIQQEITALQVSAAVASQQGNQPLANQIAEAIAGKQNDIMQAQLDAQQQTRDAAERTNQLLAEFNGSTTFNYQGQEFVDGLIGVGVGA